jgi:two-component system chemotaxis response regulator CheB
MIVQHMAPGFIDSFVDWLNKDSQLPLHIGIHGEPPLPGHVYLAPDGYHMGLGQDKRIMLRKKAPQDLLCPSVSFLFRSIVDALGPNAAGVLLTGMGKDGAAELKMMKDIGALTFAQDEASSVVHGMPGEAIKLGGATFTLPPETIARMLVRVINKNLDGVV